MLTRPIPGTDESIPVVGLGTWEVFDVAGSSEEIATRKEIVEQLLASGGSVIDSSPMYRRSEMIVGDIIKAGSVRDDLFLATKVWDRRQISRRIADAKVNRPDERRRHRPDAGA